MDLMIHLRHEEVAARAEAIGRIIVNQNIKDRRGVAEARKHPVRVYGIPRGGVPVAYLITVWFSDFMTIVSDPNQADVFVDDLIDSGYTQKKWSESHPNVPFFALYDKREEYQGKWLVFPWEGEKAARSGDNTIVGTLTNRLRELGVPFRANDNIHHHINPSEFEQLFTEVTSRCEHLLRGLLIDVDNDHNTQGTAKRMAKMYLREVFGGRYEPVPEATFFPNAMKMDEIYVTGPITIRSCCSHHLCPILGRAWVGVYPGERVIGLSKFNRLVDHICRRPQIQEEMSVQIANTLEEAIKPKGLAVIVEATHTCMTWRGVRESADAVMTTSVMRGLFLDNPAARSEFLSLVKRS